jgi:hypothetical protein
MAKISKTNKALMEMAKTRLLMYIKSRKEWGRRREERLILKKVS